MKTKTDLHLDEITYWWQNQSLYNLEPKLHIILFFFHFVFFLYQRNSCWTKKKKNEYYSCLIARMHDAVGEKAIFQQHIHVYSEKNIVANCTENNSIKMICKLKPMN